MRLIGYVRVSRVAGRGGDSFISPTLQQQRIRQLARAHGHTITGWEEDLDQPGSRIDRPAFERALHAVEHGAADGIAVAKLDRFARSVSGAARALDRLEAAGGVLVAVDLGMDTSTPAGKLMRNVLTALAEFELDRIRESWAAAGDHAISRGIHISRVPPVGYVRGPDRRLEPDPERAKAIHRLFVRRGAGDSWRDLARMLDRELPREGAWALSTVMRIVGNRAYLGEARRGDTVNRRAHPALVSRAVWERAQAAPRLTVPRAGGALLAGIIRCAGCRGAMSRMSDGRRGYANYRCRVRHAGGVCPEPARISVRRADEHVTEAFLERLAADRPVVEESARERPDVGRVLDEAEAELAAYRDANLISIIGRDVYIAGLTERAQAVDEARRTLAASRQQPVSGDRDVIERWPRLTLAKRRQLIAAGVEAVFVRRSHLRGQVPFAHRVRIVWRSDVGPVDLSFGEFVFGDEPPAGAGLLLLEDADPDRAD